MLEITKNEQEYPDFFSSDFWADLSAGDEIIFAPDNRAMEQSLVEACGQMKRLGWLFAIDRGEKGVRATVLKTGTGMPSMPREVDIHSSVYAAVQRVPGITPGVLANRLRNFIREDVVRTAEKMVQNGEMYKRRKKRTIGYYLA